VARLVGGAAREPAEPGMGGGRRRQHGVDDADALAALLGSAPHRIGDAQPAVHDPEGVADADERGVGVGVHGVEEREERRLPRRRLDDPLAAVTAVVLPRIDVAGAAGAQVEAASPVGQRRDHEAAPHVARHDADAQAGGDDGVGHVAGRRPHRHHHGVMADVRPAVVHVEDEHVEAASVGDRQVSRLVGPEVGEGAAGDRVAGSRADVGPEGAPVVAVEGHGWRLPQRMERPF
jgi:hypothetical protein